MVLILTLVYLLSVSKMPCVESGLWTIQLKLSVTIDTYLRVTVTYI